MVKDQAELHPLWSTYGKSEVR